MSKMDKVYEFIATVFGIGHAPIAPGTWGSLAGMIPCMALHTNLPAYLIAFGVFFVLGVVSSGRIASKYGEKDPGSIVIDEFAGVFLVFLFVPITPLTIFIGFILYRIVDISKIPPLKYLESLKNGWGIMLDDVVAAIYANIVLQALIFLQII